MESEDTTIFHEELLKELNLLRTSPQAYSSKLRNYAKMFKGKVLHLPNGERIMTGEGAEPFESAALFLDNLNAVPVLTESQALTAAAKEYVDSVKDLSPDQIGEVQLETFLEKRGEFVGHFAQTMDFGSNYAELVVVNLCADDGDEKRQNRNNLVDEKFKHVGLGKGAHKEFKHCTAIFYTQQFIPKGEKSTVTEEEDDVTQITNKLKDAMKTKSEEEKKNELQNESHKETQKEENEDEDFDLPEGYWKIHKEEKIVTEGGVQKKVSKITKFRDNGTKETEITKEKI